MNQFFRYMNALEKFISNSTLAVLLLAVLWGVLTRYITEKPAVWTTELSGILFTWVVFIGAATAYRENRHIKITLLVDCFSPRIAVFFRYLASSLVCVFLIFVTYLSWKMMMKGETRLSPVMNIPFLWVYLAPFLAFSVMSLTSLLRLFSLIPESDFDSENVDSKQEEF